MNLYIQLTVPKTEVLVHSQSEKILVNWKPFKNEEKCFLFHLKGSFRSQDI